MSNFNDLHEALDFSDELDVSSKLHEALYVKGLHSSDTVNPMKELQLGITKAQRCRAWLFTGHRGVGKSTELRKLANELKGAGYTVVLADMLEYVRIEEPIDTESLLLSIAAALSDAADRDLGGNRLTKNYLARFWHYVTNTEVKLTELSPSIDFGDTKLSAKLLVTEKIALTSQLAAIKNGAMSATHNRIEAFINEVVQDYQKARPGKAVVLILDSLERLRVASASSEQSKVR